MQYTEHQKLKARAEEHSAVCAFVEWINGGGGKNIRLRKRGLHSSLHHVYYVPLDESDIRKMIADYFDIDPDKFDAEQDHILAGLGEALDARHG